MAQTDRGMQVILVPVGQGVVERTGEVVERVPVVVGTRLRWREKYCWLFQEAVARVAEDREVGVEAWRVLGTLLARLDWDNWVLVTQTEMARTLGMRPQNVHRALRVLVRKGIVVQGPKAGNRHTYRLNSAFAYKGKITGLRARRRQETVARSEEGP